MNDPDEVDMDELEARLYGQVHHMADYNEGDATYHEVQNTGAKTFTRYFDGTSSTPLKNPNLLRSTQTVCSIPVAPINNIVVVQQPPTQIITHQPNSQKWVERILQKYENAHSISKRKIRQLKKKVRRRNNLKAKKQNAKLTPSVPCDSVVSAIDLSESCDLSDSCTPVKDNNVCVISDDYSNCSDDVIIVETNTEIINIDCETEQSTPSPNKNKQQQIPSPTLTDSLAVCDSNTSNDFLYNATIPTENMSTPIPNKDITYETVSSCSSTIDYCENLNETQQANFSVPSSSTFSELNLDDFTNYIASNGKRSADLASSLPAAKRPKFHQQETSSNSSDSSSESDDEKSMCSVKYGDDPKNVMESVNESETVKEDEIDTPIETNDNCIVYVDDDVDMWKTPLVPPLASSELEVNHKPERFSKYWTEDMNKFYKESWGQENFSVIEQQRKMSDDPNMWKIILKDRLMADKKPWEPRCRRCLEFGHIAFNCTKNLEPVKCSLCGVKGHKESRCPNTFCTTCGQKSPYYTTFCGGCARKRHLICPICNMTGHQGSNCPDLWRRYLFTTKDSEVQQPAGAYMKPLEDRWCSGCGMNGHFEQNCYYYNRSHAPTSVYIHSFHNVYGTNDLPLDYENVSSTDNLSDNVNEQQTGTAKDEKENVDGQNRKYIWYISQSKSEQFIGKEANAFLKLLQRRTPVTIQIKRGRKIRVVFSEGTAEDWANAKAAILRYLVAKESFIIPINIPLSVKTKKPTLKVLQKNFNCLNSEKIDWLGTAHLIYKRIQMFTDSIALCTDTKAYRERQHKLKQLYQKLNTIIIAKLKIGSDKTHMDTLEKCLQNEQILLYSFEYVFNSDHALYPNYEELIAQLPHVPNKLPDAMQAIVFENMKSSVVNICRKWKLEVWLKRIVHLYHNLVISNYSNRQSRVFKTICSKISEVVEGLRKKKLSLKS